MNPRLLIEYWHKSDHSLLWLPSCQDCVEQLRDCFGTSSYAINACLELYRHVRQVSQESRQFCGAFDIRALHPPHREPAVLQRLLLPYLHSAKPQEVRGGPRAEISSPKQVRNLLDIGCLEAQQVSSGLWFSEALQG